jgi:hypothetical protein
VTRKKIRVFVGNTQIWSLRLDLPNRVRKGRQQKAKTSTSGVGLVSTGDAEDLDAEVAVEVPADAEAIPEGRTSASATPTRIC